MIVFRLSKSAYKNDLSGRGAEIYGGRWNSKKTPMVYTSQSRALCVAEIAVHSPLGIIPKDYFLITIEIPDDCKLQQISESELPAAWSSIPHIHQTQQIGDNFIKNADNLVLKVPSAVVQGDWNFLINPLHQDISTIKIISAEEYNFDKRLFIK
ncbi:MAG TPA: RES family NAD+ phosphorylase [Bacteroidales bacterium]